jgi:hypothetical protein
MEMLAISVLEKTLAFGKDTNHNSLFTLVSQISHMTFASGIAVPSPVTWSPRIHLSLISDCRDESAPFSATYIFVKFYTIYYKLEMVQPIFFKWERGELVRRLKNVIISARFFRIQSSHVENLGCDNKDIIYYIFISPWLGRIIVLKSGISVRSPIHRT